MAGLYSTYQMVSFSPYKGYTYLLACCLPLHSCKTRVFHEARWMYRSSYLRARPTKSNQILQYQHAILTAVSINNGRLLFTVIMIMLTVHVFWTSVSGTRPKLYLKKQHVKLLKAVQFDLALAVIAPIITLCSIFI